MRTQNLERKQQVCDRAKVFHHTHLYIPSRKKYVAGFAHAPTSLSTYRSKEVEPVVDHEELYDLDESKAWLTVNRYNALVLNTRNMLIADIDFGDQRLNRFAGAQDCEDVIANLNDLWLLDEEHMRCVAFSFGDQSYRVYRTHSGCRVICTCASIPWEDLGWAAQRLMRFLRGDPDYIELCEVQQCYRARLTPKPWRENGEPAHVCVLEDTLGGSDVAEELREQLELHDELTLPDSEYSHLA